MERWRRSYSATRDHVAIAINDGVIGLARSGRLSNQGLVGQAMPRTRPTIDQYTPEGRIPA